MAINGYGALNAQNGNGTSTLTTPPTPTLSDFMSVLQDIDTCLNALVTRLAPQVVFDSIKFNGEAVPLSIQRTIAGSNINGIGYSLIAGQVNIWLSDNPIGPPDFVFVGGTSSGYVPFPPETISQITLITAGTTPAVGTIFVMQY
jgi:hypothetical protein